MTTSVHSHAPAGAIANTDTLQRWLLRAGMIGAALYPLADFFATTRYPGFSYRDQAVSELFAIGAPTSTLVVTLFSISSTLLLLFAVGIWMAARGRQMVQWVSVMMALNAIDALVLWNVFPMHMRGVQPTFTDTMHGVLAIDPFLLAALVLAAVAFAGAFRFYTVATILLTSALAMTGLSSVIAIIAGEPTPWMGVFERVAQYATNLWYAVFAVVLLREERPTTVRTMPTRLTYLGLVSGAASALTYAVMLVVVPLAWDGYSSASQTVSELSAIGAPSRALWVALGVVWMLMYAAFGWAVWKTAGRNRPLRTAGGLIFIASVVGIFWPPMHLREVLAAGGGTLSDNLHIVWTAINGLLTVLAMAFGAAALDRRFRIYSLATVIVLVVGGFMTFLDGPRLEADLSTPWMGVWERVNIGAWLLWVAVLSTLLTRRVPDHAKR